MLKGIIGSDSLIFCYCLVLLYIFVGFFRIIFFELVVYVMYIIIEVKDISWICDLWKFYFGYCMLDVSKVFYWYMYI